MVPQPKEKCGECQGDFNWSTLPLKRIVRAGEMVHCLRALGALQRTQVRFLVASWWLTISITPVSGDPIDTHAAHIHKCRQKNFYTESK